MIGIIGALDIEVERLVASMDKREAYIYSDIEYNVGTLRGKRVVIGKCGPGKVNSAVCSQIMITRFGADILINTGVAGALSPMLKQGDIVIARGFVQHDMDTSAIGDPVGFISGINMIELPCDTRLCGMLLDICSKRDDFFTMTGIIASGDQFVSDEKRSKEIVERFNASVCEMEGGAIAQVCLMANVRFCAIRCMSDAANGEAAISYSEFSPMAAVRCAELTLELIRRL